MTRRKYEEWEHKNKENETRKKVWRRKRRFLRNWWIKKQVWKLNIVQELDCKEKVTTKLFMKFFLICGDGNTHPGGMSF